MTDPLDHSGNAMSRMDRVETQVSTLSGTVTALSAAVSEFRGELRTMAVSLAQIVKNLETRDRDAVENQRAAKPNVVGIAVAMFTMISALIGGAWLIGGMTARFDERHLQRDKQLSEIQQQIDRMEHRQWEMKQ